ncbi:hypothetical protein E2C01_080436 [Portunus trituberculatus]|uniref:Uncharacterized protein n=1 Tax=Portunus trituberculatus TaxID=210409 RepID=A0A5B7IZM2_PORTR|nr:hypothetical protein [Portunus trituberculatus]
MSTHHNLLNKLQPLNTHHNPCTLITAPRKLITNPLIHTTHINTHHNTMKTPQFHEHTTFLTSAKIGSHI